MKENGEVTDTNVGDIEEDIKKLRESIIEEKYHIYNKDLKIILEHILSDYKRVLKINEVLLKENEKKDKLIERMKKYLLKENKMCDFLESEK